MSQHWADVHFFVMTGDLPELLRLGAGRSRKGAPAKVDFTILAVLLAIYLYVARN